MSRFFPPVMRTTLVCVLSLSLVGGLVSSSSARQDKKTAKKADTKKPPTTTKKAPSEPLKVVLIFPIDTTAEGVAPTLSDTIVEVQQKRLEASDKYSTVKYRRSLPAIRRGVVDGSLASPDVDKPYDASDAKVKRLASLISYPITLVTTLNDYQYDAAKNQVSLVLTMKMVDFSKDPPVVKSAGDSYTSPEGAKGKKEAAIAIDAARALTEKMMTDLLTPAKPAEGK